MFRMTDIVVIDVLVNNQTTKATHHPSAGEEISIQWPEPVAAEAQPENGLMSREEPGDRVFRVIFFLMRMQWLG